jgi:hypothetical protein
MSQQPISAPGYCGVFTNQRRPSFTITAGTRTYSVSDIRGNPVSTGTVSARATHLTPTAPLGGWPNGWYLLQLRGATGYGIFAFSIVNDPDGFAALPPWGAPANGADPLGDGHDLVGLGLAGLGTYRWQIDATDPASTAARISAIRADLDFLSRYVTRDPVRPFTAFCQFPNGAVDFVQFGALTLCRQGARTNPAHVTIAPGSATGTMALTVTDVTTGTVVESYDNQWSEQQLQAQINAHSAWLICGGGSESAALPSAGRQPLGNAATLATIQAVRGLHADDGLGITYFEGPSNEPDPTESVAAQAAAFTTSVHAGAARARALVPGVVTLSTLPTFAENCVTIAFTPDAISFHGYSTYWAFDLVRWDWDAQFLAQTRQTPGWADLVTFQTEVGDFFGEYATCFPVYAAASAILTFAYYESIGVPRQRFHWFYPSSHGFGEFPSWWRNGDSSYTPVWTAVRNLTERLLGSTFTERLSFPDPVRRFLFAARWTSAQTQSLLLQPVGISDLTITLEVSGTDTVTVYDWANNSSPITVIDGQVQLVVDQLGQWVVAPRSATVAVADVNQGLLQLSANYADPDQAGTVLSSQGPVGDQLGLARLFSKVDPLAGDGDQLWWQDSTATLPYTITLSLPVSQFLSRMLIAGVTPRTDHQTYALMGFDIEYLGPDEPSWQTCFRYDAPGAASSEALVGSWDSVGSAAVWKRVSSYDRAFIFDCPFDAPVEAVAVRLIVTRTSVGEAPDGAEVRADDETLAPATNLRFLGLY